MNRPARRLPGERDERANAKTWSSSPTTAASRPEYLLFLGLARSARLATSSPTTASTSGRSAPSRQAAGLDPGLPVWYRGLAAGHVKAYKQGDCGHSSPVQPVAKAERTDRCCRSRLSTNDYRYVLGVLNSAWGRSGGIHRLFEEALSSDLGLYMRIADGARSIARIRCGTRAWRSGKRAVETIEDPSSVRELA